MLKTSVVVLVNKILTYIQKQRVFNYVSTIVYSMMIYVGK